MGSHKILLFRVIPLIFSLRILVYQFYVSKENFLVLFCSYSKDCGNLFKMSMVIDNKNIQSY